MAAMCGIKLLTMLLGVVVGRGREVRERVRSRAACRVQGGARPSRVRSASWRCPRSRCVQRQCVRNRPTPSRRCEGGSAVVVWHAVVQEAMAGNAAVVAVVSSVAAGSEGRH